MPQSLIQVVLISVLQNYKPGLVIKKHGTIYISHFVSQSVINLSAARLHGSWKALFLANVWTGGTHLFPTDLLCQSH